VSRDYALFCAIPAEHTDAVARVLAGAMQQASLAAGLQEELRRHGFGGPPREPAQDSPSVQLQLTNACNLSCSYCCTNSGKPRAGEVSLEKLREVVREAAAVLGPGARVALLGGEPLLVPWSLELAEYVLEHRLTLTLFTNGVLLADPAIARRVAELCRRQAQVRVSLAGPTPELCDAVSGAPRFEQVMRGLHELSRQGGHAVVDLMLLPSQVDSVAAHLPALRRALPEGAQIAFGIAYYSGREQGEHLFRSRAALESALDRIAFEAGEVIPATAPSPLADRREGCTCALGDHLHVRSDGALFTCFKMEEQVGSLGESRFADVVQSVRGQPHPARLLPFCADCPLATLCGGGCRTENLQQSGDADRPVCAEWRVRVLCELLAEDRVGALDWPAEHLLAEAHARGIEAPASLPNAVTSRHLLDT
jgi:radical SAM protein with 4Fe4S-binding SPASM domain